MNGAVKRTCVVALTCAVVLAAGVFAVGLLSANEQVAKSAAIVEPIPSDSSAYRSGELIVELDDEGATDTACADAVKTALDAAGFTVKSTLASASSQVGTMLLVSTADGALAGDSLAAAANAIAAEQGIRYIQPNYCYAASDVNACDVVQDEDVAEQYYLNGPGAHGANIAAAWGKVKSSRKVDVAVLDTGVYVMREYSSDGSRLVVSEDNFHQEFDGYNLDIEDGRDFVHTADNSSLQKLVNASNPYGDDNGHGTHVSAVIAANAKTAKTPRAQAFGMAGVSQNARIIPIKVLDAGGNGDTADFISAYSYLIGKKSSGALPNLRVVNMSFSLTLEGTGDDQGTIEDVSGESEFLAGDYPSSGDEGADNGAGDSGSSMNSGSGGATNSALQKQIQAAERIGIVTVCAAGNESSSAKTYPSDYDECVSVIALDRNGRNADYSNINQYKDISAPGDDIYSAWGSQADAYAKLSGTSQATAIVSGVFSMLWANNANLTVDQAKEAIYMTAREVPGANEGLGIAATSNVSGSSGGSLSALNVGSVVNGSYGAIDAAAALDYVPGTDDDAIALPKDAAKLAKTKLVYTGKKLTPAVVVTVNGKRLVEDSDYSVGYRNNMNPGTAVATITGKGDYEGELTCKFTIVLGTTKITKLKKSGQRAFTVKWARQKSGGVGYQVRYSLKKNMKPSKVKAISKNGTTKLKIPKLKQGKKYYVQVRSYKKIGKKKYYSSWSAKKSVKVK